KELKNLVSSRIDGTGTVVTDNAGTGRVWGADLLLRYRADERFFGWVSYTLSHSTRKPSSDEPERLFLYDQPHIINVLGSYRLGRGWELGGRFRYMSGFLYRACYGGIFDNSTGSYRCYGAYEQKRLAPFHQLDVRLEKTWKFSHSSISVYIDVINAYFHNSPDYAVPKYDRSGVKALSLSLPLLPSLGIRGEL
ncbi:MAG TPA: TonB-dependent receptor, partial [Polyangiaceae bacterium]